MDYMKAASPEIRRIVVEAYQSGKATKKQLADIFGFHIAAINRWIRTATQEGRYGPLARGHKKSTFSQREREELAELLKIKPNMTLAEVRDHFSKQCSLTTVCRTRKTVKEEH